MYVNCGHPSALLMHPDGTIGRLESTATVLGFEEDWDCSVGEVWLSPGDTLLLYTDGVTEAGNENAQEFGERSLAELSDRPIARGKPAIIRLTEWRHSDVPSVTLRTGRTLRRPMFPRSMW